MIIWGNNGLWTFGLLEMLKYFDITAGDDTAVSGEQHLSNDLF